MVAVVAAPLGAWYFLTRPDYRYRRALEAIARGDYPKAEELAWRIEGQGWEDHARLLRGRIRYQEAEALVKEAVAFARLDAVETRLRWLLQAGAAAGTPVMVLRQASFHPPGTADPVLGHRPNGREQLRRNERAKQRYWLALGELLPVQGEQSVHVEAAALRGECLIRLERKREALHEFDFAAAKQPDNRHVHSQLAGLFYDFGISHMAIKHAEEMARLDPNDGLPYRFIGTVHHELREHDKATLAYEKALERRLPPAHRAEVMIELALEYSTARPDMALRLLSEFPEEFAESPEYLAIKAQCLWAERNNQEALALVESALRRSPDSQPALALRAKMYLDTDEPAPAIALLEKVVRINPSDHKTRNSLAQAYRQLGDRLQAGRPVERMLVAVSGWGPGQAGAVLTALGDAVRSHYYARAQVHMARRDELQGYMDRLTKLHEEAMTKPLDDSVRLQIAKVWLKMERTELGRVWLRAALDCNPHNAEALETLRRLNALEQP